MTLPKYILLYFCLLLSVDCCNAQNYTWEEFVEDFFQQEENIETENEQGSLLEELTELHHNPFDINKIKKENLQLLPFLSIQQTDSILSYLHRYGPILSMKELLLIPTLDKKTRDFLSLFVYCKDAEGSVYDIKARSIPKWSHQLTGNFSIPLYQREGFKSHQYKGYPFAGSIRYRGRLKDRTEWGITLQNDEGEPLGSDGNYIFDYQSFFMTGTGKHYIERWIIGDFKLHFGSGLVIGQGFWNNMVSALTFSKHTGQTIFKHTSTDETKFLRGGAVTLTHKAASMTLFGSYRLRDATLHHNNITTLLLTGLHRTQSELNRKNTAALFTTGGNLDFDLQRFRVGVSAVYTSLDKAFDNGNTLYKKYYPKGKFFSNYGIHYSYNSNSVFIQGEEAVDSKGHVAALNKITFAPSYNFKTILMHRYYDMAYNALHAFAYSARGYVKNEHGLLGGMQMIYKRKWHFKAALDYSFHPFAIYGTSRASNRFVLYTQAEYLPNDKTSFSARYHLKSHQEDSKRHPGILYNIYRHRWKLQAHYNIGILKNVSAFDLAYVTTQNKNPDYGSMISQRISTKWKKWSLSAIAAWFNTSSYASALYLYEPGPVYSFNYPACYYHGWRTAVMLSGNISHKLSFAVKYGLTYYTNRKTISSSTQLISQPYKNDLYIQINKKF